MTTGMERLRAALRGEVADRVPVFCNLFEQGARELGVSVREYYDRGERVAEGQLRLRERYGYDNVWSMFYAGREAEVLGCRRIVWSDDGPPNVGEWIVRDLADARALHVPDDVASHPAFREPERCLSMLRREVGGRVPICGYVSSSLSLASMLMGMDGFLGVLLGGPDELRDLLLEKCSAFCRAEIRAYRDAGADLVVYNAPFVSNDLLPDPMVDALALPWMVRDLEDGVEGVVLYASGARLNGVIERVLRRTGIGAYYLGPRDAVAEARAIVGDRAACVGVVNDIPLVHRDAAQIRAEVARILDAARPFGRFAFGTGIVPLALSDDALHTMLDAAYELGAA